MMNSPEWGREKKQIYGPGDEYHWEQEWTFGTI
jgi:aldose 1-epimerase